MGVFVETPADNSAVASAAGRGRLLLVLGALAVVVVVAAGVIAAARSRGVEIELRPLGFSEAPAETLRQRAAAAKAAAGVVPKATRRDRGLFNSWVRQNLSEVDDMQLVSVREVRATPPRRLKVQFCCESILGGKMHNYWIFEEHAGRLVKQN